MRHGLFCEFGDAERHRHEYESFGKQVSVATVYNVSPPIDAVRDEGGAEEVGDATRRSASR